MTDIEKITQKFQILETMIFESIERQEKSFVEAEYTNHEVEHFKDQLETLQKGFFF